METEHCVSSLESLEVVATFKLRPRDGATTTESQRLTNITVGGAQNKL